ncbi:MAG TPA: hypothetical protein GX723_09420 [Thermoanaerobacterales bacterium]|nr:hypothetical protein [Thermoanaerobacterales bacterium]
MSNKFEELKKEVQESMKSPESLGDVFLKLGITPDDPQTLQKVIKEAGIEEDLDPEKAAQLVKNITDQLPPEMKKYMAEMITNITDSVTAVPMPDDIKDLMESWKQGEKTKD